MTIDQLRGAFERLPTAPIPYARDGFYRVHHFDTEAGVFDPLGGGIGVFGAGEQGVPGIASLAVNRAAESDAVTLSGRDSAGGMQSYFLGGGPWSIEWRVRVPVLGTGTEDFSAFVGLGDTVDGYPPLNGVGWLMDRGDQGHTRWSCVNYATGNSQLHDTGVTIAAGEWVRLTTTTNAAGTRITFAVDGRAIRTHTLQIPTVGLTWLANIRKTVGNAVVTQLDCDYVELAQEYR